MGFARRRGAAVLRCAADILGVLCEGELFRLLVEERALTRNGARLQLTGSEARVLAALVESA